MLSLCLYTSTSTVIKEMCGRNRGTCFYQVYGNQCPVAKRFFATPVPEKPKDSNRSCPRWTRRINWSNRFKCWRMSTRMSKKRVNHFVSKWPGRNSKASLPSLKPLTLPLSQSCFWIHSLFCAWMCYVTSGQSYKHSMIVIYNYRVVLEANV